MVERVGNLPLLLNDGAGLLKDANRVIDEALHRAGGNPGSRESSARWVKEKQAAQKDPALLSLAHWFCDQRGYDRPRFCQIALRFPGERVGEPLKWHIDKNHFDLLLGVYLNDNLDPDSGNFIIAEGSETLFLTSAGQHLSSNDLSLLREGKEGTFESIGIPPTQVTARGGDVIAVHRALCHTTAPNTKSDYTRRVVWFRLRLKTQK